MFQMMRMQNSLCMEDKLEQFTWVWEAPVRDEIGERKKEM